MTNTILCPTRGGQASYPNQDRAIALARERGAGLLFLYIANVEFLDLISSPVLVDMDTEIEEMGEFLLTMAQERAEKAGIQAGATVRHGEFSEVLIDVIQEHNIGTVVIGSSAGGTGVVTEAYVKKLMDEIGDETGVEFIVVDQGQIVSTYLP